MAFEDKSTEAGRVLELLTLRMERGGAEPGRKLATERELMAELGISRWVVRQALDSLESQGTIRRVQGRSGGVFIGSKLQRDLSRIVGVPDYLREQGFTAGTQVVSTATLPADEQVANELGVATGQFVFEVVRIRLADGVPISLERAFFPANRFLGLLEQPLGDSLYALLKERYGVVPGSGIEHIEAVPASSAEADVLDVQPGAPLLSILRTVRDVDGTPFEHSHDLFRADRTQIVVHLTGARRSLGHAVERDHPLRNRWPR